MMVDAELVARLGRDNYIPYGARDVYGAALSREYAVFALGDGSSARKPSGDGTWRGHPREQIPWYPTVDEDLCDGCGGAACASVRRTPSLPTKEGKVAVAETLRLCGRLQFLRQAVPARRHSIPT